MRILILNAKGDTVQHLLAYGRPTWQLRKLEAVETFAEVLNNGIVQLRIGHSAETIRHSTVEELSKIVLLTTYLWIGQIIPKRNERIQEYFSCTPDHAKQQ